MILSLNINCGSGFQATTERATSSAVFARERRKSPGCTSHSGRAFKWLGSALFSSSRNLPQDTALTLSTPHLPLSRGVLSQLGLQPASLEITTSPSFAHCQPPGTSKGNSLSIIDGSGFALDFALGDKPASARDALEEFGGGFVLGSLRYEATL
jgi:hypothetical protein